MSVELFLVGRASCTFLGEIRTLNIWGFFTVLSLCSKWRKTNCRWWAGRGKNCLQQKSLNGSCATTICLHKDQIKLLWPFGLTPSKRRINPNKQIKLIKYDGFKVVELMQFISSVYRRRILFDLVLERLLNVSLWFYVLWRRGCLKYTIVSYQFKLSRIAIAAISYLLFLIRITIFFSPSSQFNIPYSKY